MFLLRYSHALISTLLLSGILGACQASDEAKPHQSPQSIRAEDADTISVFENLFPAKPQTLRIETSSEVTVSTVSRSFIVSSVRFEPENTYLHNSFSCGLVFTDETGKQQALITVGEGVTEVLSCNGLVEFGPVYTNSAAAISHTDRLGLIYNYQSPNASFKGGLVVSYNKKDRVWYVDELLSTEEVVSEQASSLAILQKLLRAPTE